LLKYAVQIKKEERGAVTGSKIIKLIVSIGVCQLAGMIGGLLTGESVRTWYTTIEKPGFTPPNWVFGPVWITLYLLMGISLFLVWTGEITPVKKSVFILFGVQLVLNIAWSFSFFYMRSPPWGLVVIVILLIFILLTAWQFYRLRALAGYLMVPYILWVSFATVLNVYLWKLNR
jgi:tryptophan-rich sensory protein